MHFDIVEAIRQKQYAKQESIRIENGDVIDISIDDDSVVIRLGIPREQIAEEEIDPSEIAGS